LWEKDIKEREEKQNNQQAMQKTGGRGYVLGKQKKMRKNVRKGEED